MADTDATKQPFHVRTNEGAFVSGHDSKAQAEADATARNQRAAKLELSTTYQVSPRP